MAGANLYDSQGRSLLSLPLSHSSPTNPEKVDRVMAVVVTDASGNPVNWSAVGGGGGGTGPASFVFEQVIPATTWVIVHNLNRYPNVVVYDTDGNQGIPDIDYHLDDPAMATKALSLQLSTPLAGKAILT